jgi:alpha-beta hydrolase superfamily lysophospholipase
MLGLALLVVLAGLAGLVVFGPRHPTAPVLAVDAAAIAADPAGWLARAEAARPGLTPGAERRIRWAGDEGARTPLAIVYIHGFSATAQETRPLPNLLAAALGANLYFARLTGHGLPGAELGRATAADWQRDLDEALAIGRAIGDRLLIVASSTAATLVTTRLTDPAATRDLAGVLFLSPNFRIRNKAAFLLDWPFAALWGPWVAGRERGFEPVNANHARFWTTRYPLRAAVPVAALVRAARTIDKGAIGVPALFVLCDADTVVDARATRAVAARWGAPAELLPVAPGPGVDPECHVLAGDILSPARTDAVAEAAIRWARALR